VEERVQIAPTATGVSEEADDEEHDFDPNEAVFEGTAKPWKRCASRFHHVVSFLCSTGSLVWSASRATSAEVACWLGGARRRARCGAVRVRNGADAIPAARR